MNIEVKFYGREEIDDAQLRYAVIASRYEGKWIFCKHRKRNTLEIPGGRREAGEAILETAKRELYEETGATDFTIAPVCVYAVVRDGQESYGFLFSAEVNKLGPLPESEIERIELWETPPPVESYTYPQIQPRLLERVCARQA